MLGSSYRNEADVQVIARIMPRTCVVNFANPRQGFELFVQCDIIKVKKENHPPYIEYVYVSITEEKISSLHL